MHPRAILVAALTLTLLAAACSSGEQTGSTIVATTSPGASTTPRAQDPSSSPTVEADASAEPSSNETPAPAPPPPGKAPQSTPPEAGTYRYRQSGESAFGEIPDEGTLVVRAATLAGDGQRQRQVRTVSDSQAAEQTLLFRSGAVLIEEIKQRVGSGAFAQTFTCTMEPPLEAVRLPVKVGARWKDTSECSGLSITFGAAILREEARTVAGRPVDTFVLRATFEASGDGIEQTTTTTSWISPDHRLVVRSRQRSEGRQGAFTYESTLTEDLLNLRPE